LILCYPEFGPDIPGRDAEEDAQDEESSYDAVWARGGQAFADSAGGVHVIQTCEGSSEKQLNDIKALEAAGVYYVSWWDKPENAKAWDYPHGVAHIAFDGISAGEFAAGLLFKKMGGKGEAAATVLNDSFWPGTTCTPSTCGPCPEPRRKAIGPSPQGDGLSRDDKPARRE
jgi:ABC-type sugar transport system substrate-binding protein